MSNEVVESNRLEIINSPIFGNTPCQKCWEGSSWDRGYCLCGDNEAALRSYLNNFRTSEMSDAQRKWCIEEILASAEGARKLEEIQNLSDVELAAMVLEEWTNYARSNCGI